VHLDTYLERIGYTGELRPTYEVLEGLHLAHATHIPFENLDILAGRPIKLDLDSLEAKLVRARRGGYCFEQNALFAAVLDRIGFDVTRLAGRVRYRVSFVLPRTHMTLLVNVDGATWIADVGFGSEGLLKPVPFGDEQESRQFAWTYRVVRGGGTAGPEGPTAGPNDPPCYVLQSLRDGAWMDLYAFTLEPQHQIDYEMANHYTSTHPESRFKKMLTVQGMSTDVKHALRNRELMIDRGPQVATQLLADEAELVRVLQDTFKLAVPEGIRFPQ
jgi:N-hydroxyarylamine O-acetyltransferase